MPYSSFQRCSTQTQILATQLTKCSSTRGLQPPNSHQGDEDLECLYLCPHSSKLRVCLNAIAPVTRRNTPAIAIQSSLNTVQIAKRYWPIITRSQADNPHSSVVTPAPPAVVMALSTAASTSTLRAQFVSSHDSITCLISRREDTLCLGRAKFLPTMAATQSPPTL